MSFSLTINNPGSPFNGRITLALLPSILGSEVQLVSIPVTIPTGTPVVTVPLNPALPANFQSSLPGDYTFIGRILDGGKNQVSESRAIFNVPAKVAVRDFSFSSQFILVRPGDSVQWINNGPSTHTTTSNTPGIWDSGALAQGTSFSHTFSTAGDFLYHCSLHPGMAGMVRVVSSLSSAGPEKATVERKLKGSLRTDRLKKAIQRSLRP